MKIISGTFKGSKLFLPQNKVTRPLKNIVKEAIFNLLNHSNKFSIKLEEKYILDLFSGTGSCGLECLSRKAKHVTFVEKNVSAINILNKNIKKLKLEKKVLIINKSVYKFVNTSFKEPFNLVFLDPPFKENNIVEIIDSLKKTGKLDKNALFIVHRHKKSKDMFPESFKILDEKKYGLSKIIFGN